MAGFAFTSLGLFSPCRALIFICPFLTVLNFYSTFLSVFDFFVHPCHLSSSTFPISICTLGFPAHLFSMHLTPSIFVMVAYDFRKKSLHSALAFDFVSICLPIYAPDPVSIPTTLCLSLVSPTYSASISFFAEAPFLVATVRWTSTPPDRLSGAYPYAHGGLPQDFRTAGLLPVEISQPDATRRLFFRPDVCESPGICRVAISPRGGDVGVPNSWIGSWDLDVGAGAPFGW